MTNYEKAKKLLKPLNEAIDKGDKLSISIIYNRILLLGYKPTEEICAHTKKTDTETEDIISETCQNGLT